MLLGIMLTVYGSLFYLETRAMKYDIVKFVNYIIKGVAVYSFLLNVWAPPPKYNIQYYVYSLNRKAQL